MPAPASQAEEASDLTLILISHYLELASKQCRRMLRPYKNHAAAGDLGCCCKA